MIAVRAIAYAVCCVLACVAARADERGVVPAGTDARPAAAAAPAAAKARLRFGGPQGAETMDVDLIAPLGRAWGDPEVSSFLATLRIEDGKPYVKRGDFTAFRHNRQMGIELTFTSAESFEMRQRDYAAAALVLNNIRFYGAKSGSIEPFTGDLPFGLRFGETRQALIGKLGPTDVESTDLGWMRWDTARYALFANLTEDGRLKRLSLQTPVVATNKPGFEAR